MECKNHPSVEAAGQCSRCGNSFCPNCLVEIQGQKFCERCKSAATQGQPLVEEATLQFKEANDALTYSIVGLFCFGIILEPIALSKALKAKKMIDQNPRLQGSGKVTAAIVISIIGLSLWAIKILAVIAGAVLGQR